MKKRMGVYIHAGSDADFSGVNKKIANHIKALSESFVVHEIILKKEKTNVFKSIKWRLPGGSWGFEYKTAMEKILHICNMEGDAYFFYLRTCPPDRRYSQFVCTLRKKFPDSIILLEIPTYPYSRFFLHDKTMWPWYFKDMVNRSKLAKCLDRIVIVSDQYKSIWGVPTITVINGINVDGIRPIIRKPKSDDSTIRLLTVARFQSAHGYERIIIGLSEYYKHGGSRNIELHMVGDGAEVCYYSELADALGLSNRIFFYGAKTGVELDDCYDDMNIGLGGFGLYKTGITKTSGLKVCEYLAKGLPVVSGAPDIAFDRGGKDFFLEYPNEPGAIDISRMIEWYDDLVRNNSDENGLTNYIRDYARNSVDIRITMRPVVEYLMNDANDSKIGENAHDYKK